jgi:hypothetical protein
LKRVLETPFNLSACSNISKPVQPSNAAAVDAQPLLLTATMSVAVFFAMRKIAS